MPILRYQLQFNQSIQNVNKRGFLSESRPTTISGARCVRSAEGSI